MPKCFHCKSSNIKKLSAIISQGTKEIDLEFDFGVEKGFISGITPLRREDSCCISTMNGHLILYDIRGNIITNSYQLNEGDSQIHCVQPFYPASDYSNMIQNDSLINSEMMVTVAFGNKNNELAVFDLNHDNKNQSALLYSYSSPLEKDPAKIPYLKQNS